MENVFVCDYSCEFDDWIQKKVFDKHKEIVGMDSEWSTQYTFAGIHLVQLCTDEDVCILSLHNFIQMFSDNFVKLLESKSILKIVFSFFNDWKRWIRMASTKIVINHFVDLQASIMNHEPSFFPENTIPSLKQVTELFLPGQVLEKREEVRSSSWDVWPLSEEQIRYASKDVEILLPLHQQMVEQGIRLPSLSTTKEKHKHFLQTPFRVYLEQRNRQRSSPPREPSTSSCTCHWVPPHLCPPYITKSGLFIPPTSPLHPGMSIEK